MKIPIHEKLFGANKTWRGLVFVSFTNAFFLFILSNAFDFELEKPLLLGFVLGLTYILAELPNSYFKRSMGVAAGESHLQSSLLFSIIDKTDSAFGVALIVYILSSISIDLALLLFVMNSLFHVFLSLLLVRLKLKSSF